MNTQVNKSTSSTIVKSVAAVLLLAACNLTINADTHSADITTMGDLASTSIQFETINAAQADLMNSLNAAIDASADKTVTYNAENAKTIIESGESATLSLQAEFITNSQTELMASLDNAISSSVSHNVVFADNDTTNDYVDLLPSLSTIGLESFDLGAYSFNINDTAVESLRRITISALKATDNLYFYSPNFFDVTK